MLIIYLLFVIVVICIRKTEGAPNIICEIRYLVIHIDSVSIIIIIIILLVFIIFFILII